MRNDEDAALSGPTPNASPVGVEIIEAIEREIAWCEGACPGAVPGMRRALAVVRDVLAFADRSPNTSPSAVRNDSGGRQDSNDSGKDDKLRDLLDAGTPIAGAEAVAQAKEFLGVSEPSCICDKTDRWQCIGGRPCTCKCHKRSSIIHTGDTTNRAASTNERAKAEAKSVPGAEREALADRLEREAKVASARDYPGWGELMREAAAAAREPSHHFPDCAGKCRCVERAIATIERVGTPAGAPDFADGLNDDLATVARERRAYEAAAPVLANDSPTDSASEIASAAPEPLLSGDLCLGCPIPCGQCDNPKAAAPSPDSPNSPTDGPVDLSGDAAAPEPSADGMPYPDDPGKTHYPECWRDRGHHNCAIAEVERLRAAAPASDAAARYSIQEIPNNPFTSGVHFRITDNTTDSRVATCYLREHAEMVCAALNAARTWLVRYREVGSAHWRYPRRQNARTEAQAHDEAVRYRADGFDAEAVNMPTEAEPDAAALLDALEAIRAELGPLAEMVPCMENATALLRKHGRTTHRTQGDAK